MRRFPACLLAVCASLSACATPAPPARSMKITPLLTVDDVAASLPFWVERLEFENVVEVPGDDGSVGFAMLQRDGLEVMLQSTASVAADDAGLAKHLTGGASCLYIEVEDLERMKKRLDGLEVVVPERTTFYGSTEIFVREPGGHVIGFAQPAAEPK